MTRAAEMAFQVLPATVGFEGAVFLWAAVRAECLMRSLVFTQITRVGASKLAEATLVRLFALM